KARKRGCPANFVFIVQNFTWPFIIQMFLVILGN
ncbi:unnamed protein product, partial [Allacma fusca]